MAARVIWKRRLVFESRSARFDVALSSKIVGRQSPELLSDHRRGYASKIEKSPAFDHETDVLIVGSGGAGLVAALRANDKGLRALVIEKTSKIGGSTAYSGGGVWIPNNPIGQALGFQDSQDTALEYLEATIDNVGPSSRERKVAFLENGPKMVSFLRNIGFQWRSVGKYPDYYPWVSGGKDDGAGRCIEACMFNKKRLGSWANTLNQSPALIPPLHLAECNRITRVGASLADFRATVWIMSRQFLRRLVGQEPVLAGLALTGRLLMLNLERRTQIWRKTPLLDLITDSGGAVIGARVEREGLPQTIRAKSGVLLAAGGFAHNKQMREEWMPLPASTQWTSASPADTGDAVRAGMKVGGATALLDDAWWGPAMIDPQDGTSVIFAIFERSRPFSIIVDSSGSRFMNEAQSYSDAGHCIYERHQTINAVPAWLIVDWSHRKRYLFGTVMPRQDFKATPESGVYKASTISDLASQIGVDSTSLQQTITRFNHQACKGVDSDFGRGSNAYDNFFGDPKISPNPNLGPIEKPPFYAVKLWPGDLGTKGGLLTDKFARVLKEDGSIVKGLYAAGNTSASVMGRKYPGPGATLGPAMTFAFIAMDHIASSRRTSISTLS